MARIMRTSTLRICTTAKDLLTRLLHRRLAILIAGILVEHSLSSALEKSSSAEMVLAPPTPDLVSPSEGAKNISIRPRFVWRKSPTAIRYQLQVAIDPLFDYRVYNDSTVTDTSVSITATEFANKTLYYWRVRAFDSTSASGFSAGRSFTTILEKPLLIEPANRALGVPISPSFLWKTVDGASGYEIQVFDRIFDSLNVVFDTTVTNSDTLHLTSKSLLNGHRYYCCVLVSDLDTTVVSDTTFFETIVKAPGLYYPRDALSGVPPDTTIYWTRVVGARGYTLRILSYDDSSVVVPPPTPDLQDTTYRLFAPLASFSEYVLRVAAKDPSGKTVWGNPAIFRTRISTPVLLSPPGGSQNVRSDTLYLRWNKVAKAVNYNISLREIVGSTDISPGATVAESIRVSLKPDTRYRWMVQAVPFNDVPSLWSPEWDFRTIVAKPSKPVLVEPPNNAFGVALAVTLRWKPSATPVDIYQIQLTTGEFDDSTVTVSFESGIPECKILYSLVNNKRYLWRVRAQNIAGSGDWSEKSSFRTRQSPPPQVYPPDLAKGISLNDRLAWNQVDDAWSYDVEISSGSEFTPLTTVYRDSIITGLQKTLPQGIGYYSTYFWRVRVQDIYGGTSDWSPARSFTTKVSQPTLSKPDDGQTNVSINPTLQWDRVVGAERYRLQVSDNKSYTAPVLDTLQTENSKPLNGRSLLNDCLYFWRVQALDVADSAGAWSQRSFRTIIAAPPIPILALPQSNSERLHRTVTLRWKSTPRAEQYTLELSRDNFATTDGIFTNLRDTSKTIGTLQWYTDYFWKVRASNIGGPSPYSGIWQFRTTVIGDFNGDGRIDGADFDILKTAYKASDTLTADIGPVKEQPPLPPRLTPLRDGKIDFEDLMIFGIMWNWTVANPQWSLHPLTDGKQTGEIAQNFSWKVSTAPECQSSSAIEFSLRIPKGSTTLALELFHESNDFLVDSIRVLDLPGTYTLSKIINGSGYSMIVAGSFGNGNDTLAGSRAKVNVKVSNFRVARGKLLIQCFGGGGQIKAQDVLEFKPTDPENAKPRDFSLEQNYPNPFNPSTMISYRLPARCYVQISILNILGQMVASLISEEQNAGRHQIEWKTNSSSGVYLCRIHAISTENSSQRFSDTIKMVLIR